MTISADRLDIAARTLVRVTGTLARFCDRAEHNEGVSRDLIITAGEDLRMTAMALLRDHGIDPLDAYASRLAQIEARHPLAGANLFEADQEIRYVKTWRELQRAQARHDAVYHPDVAGLAKIDQLRHYTLHLAKLAWLLQDAANEQDTGGDIVNERVPDVLVFGVKLATVCGQLLADEPVDIVNLGARILCHTAQVDLSGACYQIGYARALSLIKIDNWSTSAVCKIERTRP